MSDPGAVPAARRQRKWWGILLAGIWLVYLLAPAHQAWQQRHHVGGWVGAAALLAFSVVYLGAFVRIRSTERGGAFHPGRALPGGRWAGIVLSVLAALGLVACGALGQSGTACSVYVGVVAMLSLPGLWGWAFTGANALLTFGSGFVIPGWRPDPGLLFGLVASSLAVWAMQQSISHSFALIRANEVDADLAVAEERNRFARDLHDILGHSLTVITVKAELAGRLLEVDPGRAAVELKELETLSRDALADVRQAVHGYRGLTLAGEIARAHSALAAAGIAAELPGATDDVDSGLRELFAWTIREGVTNVVRHSQARRCTVSLTARGVEIRDDGIASEGELVEGAGLRGLRERAEALNARVSLHRLTPGLSLRVQA